ncbi:L,D-transpeptidase [Nocardioides bruguierae]|uniref:L,D-transpeptidase n=1 Tax=Nocardioides bruguierae TaxID=2945102 RepID=UPI002021016E|nr:Ig-like domain-containing protein [Nocardioides bruguierae]MCL8027056.1 Ig-like domain-containing protein [Nocardioides bruguierae]
MTPFRTSALPRRGVLLGTLAVSAVALTACQDDTAASGSTGGTGTSDASSAADSSTSAEPSVSPASVTVNCGGGEEDVPVSRVVTVTVANATLTKVAVRADGGEELPGTMADNQYSWRADDRLEPGTTYQVRAVAVGDDGAKVNRKVTFRTQDLTLAQQTYPSIAPLEGETVGVGMPVIVTFDVAVSDQAAMERQMTVTAQPAQDGAWHWLSQHEVHWRPKSYWQAGSKVTVDVAVNGVDAGDGVYGQLSRRVSFDVGDAHVYRVNAKTHEMKVFSNGKLLRTLPITTGKPGFDTRNGTKVIIEKFASKRMNSETVGISGAEAYNISGVKWAMRLTYSGEFIHAAPWSVSSQGNANVSHGCTGMSTANAGWLYEMSRRGDVVVTTGTNGNDMTLTNGWGDWNESFRQWRKGSALA